MKRSLKPLIALALVGVTYTTTVAFSPVAEDNAGDTRIMFETNSQQEVDRVKDLLSSQDVAKLKEIVIEEIRIRIRIKKKGVMDTRVVGPRD